MVNDRVEIENPGRLPFDLTPETIKSAHASYPYNPLIAEVLFKSSFLESWGAGVGRMIDACHAQGVPEPEYEVASGFVRIVFRRTTGKATVLNPNGKVLARSWQGVGSGRSKVFLIIERNTANCHIYCKNVVEFKNNSVSLRRKRY